MASLTQWTRIWVNSESWLWTGRPGVLQSMGSQRVGHDWVTELNWTGLEIVEGREAWCAASIGLQRVGHNLVTKQQRSALMPLWESSILIHTMNQVGVVGLWCFWLCKFMHWTWGRAKRLCLLKNSEELRDFPGSPVVKTPSSQCRWPGFDPWPWN